jgi:SAM-dependent methyltransferase
MTVDDVTRKNLDYTRSRWTGLMRSLAPLLYTELIHYHYLYRWLDRRKQDLGPSVKVLDVGFGSGYNIGRLARRYGVETLGTDIAKETVDFYNAKRIPRSRAVLIDAGSPALPFGDGEMDLVVCSHVLEHVPDDRSLLAEIRRVLKPGGAAYFNVPINEETIAVPNHMRKYTPASFLALLSGCGFAVTESFESDGFSRLVSWLGVNRSLVNGVAKKILIAALSLAPVPLLELVPLKKSQFVCFCGVGS